MESFERQPFLSTKNEITDEEATQKPFYGDHDDISVAGIKDFFSNFSLESKKLWYLAGPAIFTSICQYNISSITQLFVGQLGTMPLAAVAIQNSVAGGFNSGVMIGMVSALETLSGQAFGAGQVDILGVYLQRAWVILSTIAIVMTVIVTFATPILRFVGQTDEISRAAGAFAMWTVPLFFGQAMMLPLAKFLQAQSKIVPMALISVTALVLHTFLSWLMTLKLGWGLIGAAMVLNLSWWFLALALLFYVLSGSCGRAWSGFSWKAFQNLWQFVKLSLKSAIMFCLEILYFNVLVLSAGHLKDAAASVDVFSISMNLLSWTSMAAAGLNVAISVRVSNELGSMHSRAAKFSVVVAMATSTCIGLFLALVLSISRNHYPALFSNSPQVQQSITDLTPFLGFSIVINNIQYVCTGVAVGSGWQALVAYMSIGCYFLIGIPSCLLMSYKFNMGVKGIWFGLISGVTLQTSLVFLVIYRTKWNKEVYVAGARVKQWKEETKVSPCSIDLERTTH